MEDMSITCPTFQAVMSELKFYVLLEHAAHVSHFRHIPITDIDCVGASNERVAHINNLGHIPTTNVAAETVRLIEHAAHVCNLTHVPATDGVQCI